MSGKRRKIIGVMAAMALTIPLPGGAYGMGPDTVELGSLANHYEPVSFDHAMHVELAEDCSTCHHHTTGTPPLNPDCLRCHARSGEGEAVACKDCHPADRFGTEYMARLASDPGIYHVGKPGLKGAYHQNCLGCHTEMGAPAGCQDCHARTEAGDAFFYSGNYAPAPGKAVGGGH
jgi:hypothetical protein